MHEDRTSTEMIRVIAGLAVLFGLFHVSAELLHSDRGQAGLLLGALVLLSTLSVERVLFHRTWPEGARALGLGRPAARGLLVAGVVALLLLAIIPLCARALHARMTLQPGWSLLLPGLFAQAGLAEELLFRGYLFGHARAERSFWRAAALSTVPFVAVHLLLFLTMPWPIALAAVLLATSLSFPLAHLYELGGRTIWAPALLHFVVQSAVKIVELDGPDASLLPLVWMGAAAILPFFAFVVSRPRTEEVRRASLSAPCQN